MGFVRPNVRAKRGADGMPPGPGYRKCTPYLWPGPGGMPLVLRLSEGLGLSGQLCINATIAEFAVGRTHDVAEYAFQAKATAFSDRT